MSESPFPDNDDLSRFKSLFDVPEPYSPDYETPEELNIHFSKKNALMKVIFFSIMSIFGLYGHFKLHIKYISHGFITFGLVAVVKNLNKFFNNLPQIIISKEGMEAGEADFYGWEDIENESIISQGLSYYLSYDHPGEKEKVPISGLEIDKTGFEKILSTYRRRHTHGKQF